MKNLVILFGLLLMLSGCSAIVQDKTDSLMAKGFVGSYFYTTHEAFLYKARCADVSESTLTVKWCMGIQSFNADRNYTSIPNDYKTYLSAQKYWDKKLFTKLMSEEQRSIVQVLPKGTLLKINKLIKYSWKKGGDYWTIKAQVINARGVEIEVELPTNPIFAFPTWLQGYNVETQPVFKADFLKPCLTNQCKMI